VTDYGVTPTGFRRKTYEEIQATLQAWQRDKISTKLDLSFRTVLGNLNAITSEELETVWELAEVAYGALDPDNAAEALLVGLCKLTGVYRLAATYGTIPAVTLTFDRATTIPAGSLLLAVDGESTNLWANDSAITVAAAGSTDAAFTSTTTGADAAAAAGTLTVIATPITGLVSATNALDATSGTDQESLDALRARREASLAGAGRGTTSAIASALAEVAGVIAARVIENDTTSTVDGIPPRTIRPLVWDGEAPAAANADIAQAIYDSKGSGQPTFGATTEDATDPWGDPHPVNFDRADAVQIWIYVNVQGSTTEAAVIAALLAAHAESIGQDVIYNKLVGAAVGVQGVDDVLALYVDDAAAPDSSHQSNIVIASDAVGVLDSSRIDVDVTL
jgi:uncharacterized phage protein gp47/JayE